MAILGIDIGGTKLAAGMVTVEGQILSYSRQPTPQNTTAEELAEVILKLASGVVLESGAQVERVGVGCGGPMQFPAGVVSPLHIPVWQAFPLRDWLADRLGLAVVVDNDAKALALGEALFGAGQGAKCLLGMVVSTGVGGGLVVDGRLFHGKSGNAGHIGHVIVSSDGPGCDCGAVGCLTAWASGPALARRARSALKDGANSRLALIPSPELTAQAIAKAATEGDQLSARLIEEAGTALGRGIASAANLLDLDRVVIGGGVAASGPLLFEPLRQELAKRAKLAFSAGLTVVPAGLGANSGVIGAAALSIVE